MNHGLDAILSLDSATFVQRKSGRYGSTRRAVQSYRSFYRDGRLGGADAPPITRTEVDDGTIKFCLDVDNGHETESVIIPRMRSDRSVPRSTLCVSSQVGCALGCAFCETAQMGLIRNLTAAEIVIQWWIAAHSKRLNPGRSSVAAPRNIVFMGMGEPMDNLEAVLGAIRVFADRNGPAVAPANISVSTVGRAAGIRRYAEFARNEGFRQLKLAVSINAPNDTVRSSIMPVNRAEPMAELMDAMLQWASSGRAPILIEYVVIPGVNDDLDHADELCAYLGPLPCKVNLIPYNPRRDSPWPAPDERIVGAFRERLVQNGVFVTRRTTQGRGAMAACGQLGNPRIRRRRFVQIGPDNPDIPSAGREFPACSADDPAG